MHKHRIDLAILDVDGVVLNSFNGTLEAVNKTLVHFGARPVRGYQFRRARIRKFEQFMRSRGIPQDVPITEVWQVLDRHLDQPELYQEREGIRKVLSLLKRKTKSIQLLSACNTEMTRRKVGHHAGLLDFVDGVHGDEDKDQAIARICDETGISVANCLFIADMDRDLILAKQAGVPLILGIKSDFSRLSDLLEHGHRVVHTHDGLARLLEDLLI